MRRKSKRKCETCRPGPQLIMMGQHDRAEALFYYFRLEDQIPETHLLRLIDKHVSFSFVCERLKDSYSDTGRPSSILSFCCVSC